MADNGHKVSEAGSEVSEVPSVEKREQACGRSLHALYLSAPEDVAADVNQCVGDYIEALRARIAAQDAALREIRGLLVGSGFTADWCAAHMVDDHLCDLDHKDEIEIAELIFSLRATLALHGLMEGE